LLTGGFDADDTAAAVAAIVAKRGVAYMRESSEEQGEGFSPGAQRQKIFEWAENAGIEIVGEYCDLHSAWRKSEARPEFQRLMADAADGKFDVVLVFHTSRFARNTVEAKRYKQLLRERMNIEVISVNQPFGDDPSEPSSFLAESINEMFDEYYSVSLSFWTRSGLHEKARQGHLVGLLPWGYMRDLATKLAVPDPQRASLVLGIFARYDTGQESDRSLAAWLNAKGARTRNDREFCADTVRDMLRNAAYCGYVSGMRDISKSIKGLHEPIVPEELFDRVQQIRHQRARTHKPGRPSNRYLLRGIARCRRCDGKMQGTGVGRNHVARYYCATRRKTRDCDQPVVPADEVERQLVEFIQGFAPEPSVREEILRRLAEDAGSPESSDTTKRRATLEERLRRMRDLYELGDLKRPEYLARRDTLNAELAALAPEPIPDFDQARKVLEDFKVFWTTETDPDAKREFLSLIFQGVWLDERRVVAVQPKPSFLAFFENHAGDASGNVGRKVRERRDSNPRPLP
jgi:DNA invertase Pin-like site-specific DNA recombinase